MAGFNLVFTRHGEFLEVVPSTTERIVSTYDHPSRSVIAQILTKQIPVDWQHRISVLYHLELQYRTERLALYREFQAQFPAEFQPLLDNIKFTHPELLI